MTAGVNHSLTAPSNCKLISSLFAVLVLGCSEPPPQAEEYQLGLTIYGDPGKPVAGARVSQGARPIAESDAEGRVAISSSGSEGQVLAFQVHCPEGYRSPPQPISVVLKRVAESDRRPEYQAHCEPLLRTAVVAVRAEHGPDLPVLYLGREVARTDSSGAAHFMLKSPPDDSIEITLDTSQYPKLRPHNPSARFQVAQRDDVFVFEQTFRAPPPPSKRPVLRRAPGIINLRR